MSLTNAQYDQLMRIYSLRQSENQRALERRQQEAYGAVPELRTLDEQISSAAVESARASLALEKERAEELRSEIPKIATRRRKLLAGNGFPEDYLQMQYHCPDCKDTGYIGTRRCHCFMHQAVDLFYTQSGLRPVLEKENFDHFSLDCYSDREIHPATGLTPRENMKRILRSAHDFADSFTHESGQRRENVPNLFLYGGTGLGKTFLSHCIAKQLLDEAFSVIYYTAFDLFEGMARETFGHDSREEEKDPFADYLLECDLLIIDDLGTEMTNTFVASSLFQLLNERLIRGRSTLISTNLSLSAFADTYTERVFSRITSSYTLLGLYGDDIRLKKALQKN